MEIAVLLKAAGVFVLGILTGIANFIIAHKEIISAIVLRVERDTADGTWTNEEKEQEALDIYNDQIYPKLPIQIKAFLFLVPQSVINKWIRSMIQKVCAKSKEVTVTQ